MRLDWPHGLALARARPGRAAALVVAMLVGAVGLWEVALRYYGEIWAIAVIGAGLAVVMFVFRADRTGDAFELAVLLFGALAAAVIVIPSVLVGLLVWLIATDPVAPYAASALSALALACGVAAASVLVRT